MIIIYFVKKINRISAMRSKFILFFCGSLFAFNVFSQSCELAKDSSRIAVAGGSLTEIIFLLGAQERIVAADITSNYPEEANSLPSIGYVRALSTEGILSLEPTLIIGEDDMGPPSVLEQLSKTGVEIKVIPEEHSSQGIVDKILCIAALLGETNSAKNILNNEITPKIYELEKISEDIKSKNINIMFILGMQSGSPLVAGKNTSADGFINMIGGKNIMTNFTGWKPVGAEAIINGSPDYILISKRGLKSFGDINELYNHPSLMFTPAAENENIIVMDGMAMLGFSSRTILSATEIGQRLQINADE